MKWLSININQPKLDCTIIVRTSDEFGLGSTKELFEFDSKLFTEEEAEAVLQNRSFIEWMEIPE